MWERSRERLWWEELRERFLKMCKRRIGGRTGTALRWCATWEVGTGSSIRWERCCTKLADGSAIHESRRRAIRWLFWIIRSKGTTAVRWQLSIWRDTRKLFPAVG